MRVSEDVYCRTFSGRARAEQGLKAKESTRGGAIPSPKVFPTIRGMRLCAGKDRLYRLLKFLEIPVRCRSRRRIREDTVRIADGRDITRTVRTLRNGQRQKSEACPQDGGAETDAPPSLVLLKNQTNRESVTDGSVDHF